MSPPKLVFGTGEWHPLLEVIAGVPVIEGRIGGQGVRALIDSGAQSSVLDQSLAQALQGSQAQKALSARAFEMPMVAHGVGGQAQVGRGLGVDVDLPGLTVRDLRVALLDLGPLAHDPALGVGLIIGRDLMREAVIEIDWDQRRVRFCEPALWQPSARFWPLPVERSGDALTVTVKVENVPVRAVIDTGSSSLLSVTETEAQRIGLNDGREATAGASLVLGGMTQARWVKVAALQMGEERWDEAPVAVFPASNLPNYPDALLGMEAFAGRMLALNLGQSQLYLSRPLDLRIG